MFFHIQKHGILYFPLIRFKTLAAETELKFEIRVIPEGIVAGIHEVNGTEWFASLVGLVFQVLCLHDHRDDNNDDFA